MATRLGKGTHTGLQQLQKILRKVSLNGHRDCFALKMDIRRFFDSVGHQILKRLIKKRVKDEKVVKLVDMVIDSFAVHRDGTRAVDLPLGNVTSQLFANIYLHELDVFVKHRLRPKYYLRYCDDFVLVSHEKSSLTSVIDPIQRFLKEELLIRITPQENHFKKAPSRNRFFRIHSLSKSSPFKNAHKATYAKTAQAKLLKILRWQNRKNSYGPMFTIISRDFVSCKSI
ncbi:MAG: RNA-directed DNA polymerase [Candidatus Neptunochlamydia sp.]|nr:RNA-directed DNA polymerase [Candidatus Neptunochlamydia sp.]